MAKGDVQMKFDAQTGSFIAAVLKAKEALEQTGEKGRKFGEDMKNSGDKAVTTFQKMKKEVADSAGDMISRFGNIGTAMGLLSSVWNSHLDGMIKKAGMFQNQVQTIQNALGSSGQIGALPEVRSQLRTIGGNVMTQKDVEGTFSNISKRAGAESTPQEKIRATQAAVNARAAGIEDVTAFGSTFAELSKSTRKGGALEKFGDAQLEELVARIIQFKPQGLDDKDVQFFNRGKQGGEKGALQALDIIMASARSSESSRARESLEGILDVEVSDDLRKKGKRTPKRLTDEERRQLRLSEIPEADRLNAVLKDPTLAPAANRRMVTNLSSDLTQDESLNALRGDAFGRQQAEFKKLENTNVDMYRMKRQRLADIETERLDLRKAGESMDEKTANQEQDNTTRRTGVENGYVRGFLNFLPSLENAGGAGSVRDPHLDALNRANKLNEQRIRVETTRRGTSLESDAEGQK